MSICHQNLFWEVLKLFKVYYHMLSACYVLADYRLLETITLGVNPSPYSNSSHIMLLTLSYICLNMSFLGKNLKKRLFFFRFFWKVLYQIIFIWRIKNWTHFSKFFYLHLHFCLNISQKCLKVWLSPSKNVFFICFNDSPSKMMKNTLFHLKRSFCSQDILIFVLTFCLCRKNGLIRNIQLISKFMTSHLG